MSDQPVRPLAPGCCPHCGGASAGSVGTWSIRQLIDGYAAPSLGVDVASYFPDSGGQISLQLCSTCDLRWYAPMPTGDGPFYERLQQLPWYYQADKPEYHFAAKHVQDGCALLEVGCGAGEFAGFLPKGASYRGLEFNDAAIQKARARGLKVDALPVEQEAAAHPASYDVVCTFQVLEHVSQPREFLGACVQALKPGGVLLVAVPADDSFLRLVPDGWLNMPPHHVTRWSDKALQSAVRMQGCTVEDLWHESVADYHQAWYGNVMREFALGGRPATPGSRSRAASSLARRARRVPMLAQWLERRGEAGFPYAGRGHTVCVVGRKCQA